MGKTSFWLVVLAGLTAQDKIVELDGLAKIFNNFYGQKSYIGKMDRPAKFGEFHPWGTLPAKSGELLARVQVSSYSYSADVVHLRTENRG